jgi:hypothetical protein
VPAFASRAAIPSASPLDRVRWDGAYCAEGRQDGFPSGGSKPTQRSSAGNSTTSPPDCQVLGGSDPPESVQDLTQLDTTGIACGSTPRSAVAGRCGGVRSAGQAQGKVVTARVRHAH